MSKPSSLILPNQDRRQFLKHSAVAVAAGASLPSIAHADDKVAASQPESLVKVLFESLKPEQRSKVCYAWDHIDPKRGLLRTRVANNWMINEQEINSDFYTAEQKDLIRKIFEGVIQPEWHANFDKQMEDDCGGFGEEQSVAIFGQPGSGLRVANYGVIGNTRVDSRQIQLALKYSF